ncbi:MAG: ABC transporter ATP-binding protein [Candidatus Electrothrix sp. AUS4]|nr:ABC transporter ATP-binding protein [Candidatus Electrothrix sp. AUS4]
MLGLIDEILADYTDDTGEAEAKPLNQLIVHAQERIPDPPRDVVFSCENLGKTYKKSGFCLHGVDLQLRFGEITGVVGENGNGKTTLFRIVAGELLHDQGNMSFPLLQEESTAKKGINWINVKEKIAYVPQELPKIYGSLEENLQYEAAIHGVRGEKNLREVDFIVQRLALGEHLEKRWKELSGGFKLRFALARALVWKPKLLIIDEPLANLDIITQDVFLKDLRNLADSLSYPMSVLISSQHLHEVEALADRILFLKEGAIKFNASKKLLGQNRSYNTFELTISCDEEMLREHLRQLSPQEIRHSGIAHIVTLPLSVTGNRLLQHLLDRGVEIRYFRDISCSIKPLFDETNASN